MSDALTVTAAITGGLLPALLWLWFWLREDASHPEPRRLIALAFLAGMIAVAAVVPIEQWVETLLPTQTDIFIVWAAIEELTKFLFAWIAVLRLRDNDEPIDAVMYLVAVALGFAAAENTLFLLSPVAGSSLPQIIVTGDFRFIGATLLHVLSSAVIGAGFALSFYKPARIKRLFVLCGVILSILLHAAFNLFILNLPVEDLLRTFSFVWIGLVGLIALLEYIKRIRPRSAY